VGVKGLRSGWYFRRALRLAFEAAERRAQIVEHGFEAAVQRGAASHDHIIMVWSHGCGVESLHEFAQSAADAVAFRCGADFLVTVKPTRTGPLSPRARLCTTKAGLAMRGPLAAATKSARCLNRSMIPTGAWEKGLG
jgi:hypothetical protein